MSEAYPLSIDDQRTLPADYEGNVFVWDIDKTYLSTRFSSVRGLARIPIEFAIDKHAIPGMPEVLRGLRRGPGPDFICAPLYFVSASPPVLRKVVENKMLLDGVEHDGIIFKDWIATLRMLRPGRLREQVGFKMAALLTGRLRRMCAREYLFGDDVESDAQAFSLYAKLLDGEMAPGELEDSLHKAGVKDDDRRIIHQLAGKLEKRRGKVERIFIHLERNTPPAAFERYGQRLVPVKGGFQLALALVDLELIDADAVSGAAEAAARSRRRYGSVAELSADAAERGLIRPERLDELVY